MARILIGWELGANRGHVLRLMQYHDAFVAAGYQVSLALQRIDGLASHGCSIRGAVWQAPLWPRLLATLSHVDSAPVATMGDILGRLGLADRGAMAAMIAAWDRLLAADRPDLIFGDFAPALLCAARGRLPTIAIGNGFTMPPPAMARFPSLNGAAPLFDEAALLAEANAALATNGRDPLAALPELFAADRELLGVFTELDPYAEWRTGPAPAPELDLPLPPTADGRGDELFVYWPERALAASRLWDGLERAGMPVRMYVPQLSEQMMTAFEARGFTVERHSMAFDRIAVRARMVLSHGGLGFTSMAMAVGLPQVIVHYDLEKGFHGAAIERLGIGAQAHLSQVDQETFALGLRQLWDDRSIGERARAKAEVLRGRLGVPPLEHALAAAGQLAS